MTINTQSAEQAGAHMVADGLKALERVKKMLRESSDPALNAVEDFKAAKAAFEAAPSDGAISIPLFDEMERSLQAMARVRPTTIQGVIDLLETSLEEEAPNLCEKSSLIPSIHSALDALKIMILIQAASTPKESYHVSTNWRRCRRSL